MPPSLAETHVTEPAPQQRRSLFPNYNGARGSTDCEPLHDDSRPPRRDDPSTAEARCFVALFLARTFEYPSAATWRWLSDPLTHAALREAAVRVALDAEDPLTAVARNTGTTFTAEAFGAFHDDYVSAIGHAARGSCPINEIEYGDLKADPLLQPHRLADLAAFYRAFGLEVADSAGERPDHLGAELEFLAVLTGQERQALLDALPDEILATNLNAQRVFLREHLGRWSPTFARRLEPMTSSPALQHAARLLLAFVAGECRRAGIPVGGDEVALRPADEEAALCDSCGLQQRLPGNPATAVEA